MKQESGGVLGDQQDPLLVKDGLKSLLLLGYAPAAKAAWPQGELSGKLEALDLRHGVSPNLVMTPMLSAACYLPTSVQPRFLAYVKEQVLGAGASRNHCRYNVLSNNVGTASSEIDDCVREIFGSRLEGQKQFNPSRTLVLVFSFWAASALFSYLIEGEVKWTKSDLKQFGTKLLKEVRKHAAPKLAEQLNLSSKLPRNVIPRLGLYFRICTAGEEEEVRHILRKCVDEIRRSCSGRSEFVDDQLDWVVSALRSIVPLPHNEVYQNYRKGTNPIGKYQACFVNCQDPKLLAESAKSELMWEYIGSAVARRLCSQNSE